jgi:DNA end-binding protein Ku
MATPVWKGFISFGLISFPVQLYSAARAETVRFHMLHRKDQSRVKEVWYCIDEDKPIERSDIEKGYEISDGKYVIVEDAELKRIAPPTATSMDILQFVDSDAVDPIYFERSYYVAAQGKTPKPYVLFVAVLTHTRQDAIAKIAMHNREHIVLIRPYQGGLLLHTLYYEDELRSANMVEPPAAKYSARELELARSLVTHLKAPFKPEEFKDTYRENIELLIEQKRKGRRIPSVEQPRKAQVIDLMEALKRSLKAAGKPTSASRRSSRAPAPKRTSKRRAAA